MLGELLSLPGRTLHVLERLPGQLDQLGSDLRRVREEIVPQHQTVEQIEQRLARLEAMVADVSERLPDRADGPISRVRDALTGD